jgi:hypothetical protein
MLDFSSRDEDADGFRVNGSGQVCAGTALPPNRSATQANGDEIDCDDGSPAKWRVLPFASRDIDGDGYRANEPGEWCGQDTLPPDHSATTTAVLLVDCNDADVGRWRWMAVYRDADHDGTGSGSAVRQCVGTVPDAGYALTGYDPVDDPNDPAGPAVSTIALGAEVLTVPDDADDEDVF